MRVMPSLVIGACLMLAGAAGPAAAQESRDQAEAIEYLVDRAAIQDLVAGYAVAMDAGDAEAYAALFAEDAEFKFGNNHLKSRAEIMERMAPVLASQINTQIADSTSPTRLRHMLSAHTIDIDGDTATVRGNWITASARSGDGVNIGALGYFNDTMVKQDGVWKYKARNVVVELASEAAIAANNGQ